MPLKRILTAAEHAAIAPELQALYVAAADGNGFSLEVEPDPALRAALTQVGEFRENNLVLTRQAEEDKRKSTPPPESAAMAEQLADQARAISDLQAENKRERDGRAEDRFESRVREVGKKNGLNQDAEADAAGRARLAGFRVVDPDGTVAAFKGDIAVMSKRDPSVRLTLTEWMHDLRRDGGGHLFKPSRGTDGRPQESTGTIIDGVLRNPSEQEFGKNLADIASGKIQVGDTSE